MADDLKINGRTATHEDFAKLERWVKEIGRRKEATVLADNSVTKEELNRVLDVDFDGQLQWNDLLRLEPRLGLHQFIAFGDFLNRYGFNMFAETVDFDALHDMSHDNRHGRKTERIIEKFRNVRGLVLEMVKKDGRSLEFADSSLQADREIVLEAVKQDPHALQYVAPFLKSDQEFVARLLDVSPSPDVIFSIVDPSLKSDREFFLKLMKQHGGFLQFADSSLQADREIVLEAVKQDPRALQYADKAITSDRQFVASLVRENVSAPKRAASILQAVPDLMADPKFILLLIQEAPLAFYLLNDGSLYWEEGNVHMEFRNSRITADKDMMLEVLSRCTEEVIALKLLSPDIQKDPAVVFLRKVQHDWRVLKIAGPALRANQAIVLAAVRQNKEALGYADPALLEDASFLVRLVLTNPYVFKLLDDRKQMATVQRLLPLLGRQEMLSSGEMVRDFQSFLKDLEHITSFPDRFGKFEDSGRKNGAMSLNVLYTLWKNRANPVDPTDHRPVALLICTKNDWNKAYEISRVIPSFMDSGKFRVLYFEVGAENEFHQILGMVTQGGKTPVHTLVLAGHGTQSTLALGGSYFWDEKHYIDTGDFRQGDFARFPTYIDPHGQILLFACSNGAGETGGENLANAFARILPTTVTVYSSQIPAGIVQLNISPDLRLRIEYGSVAYNPRGMVEMTSESAPANDAPKPAVLELREKLKDPDPSVRQAAKSALADLKDRTIVPALIEDLNDPDDEVTSAAVKALGYIGNPTAAPALIKMITAAKFVNQRSGVYAAQALADLNDRATFEKLFEVLDDPARTDDQDFRVDLSLLSLAFGETKDPAILEGLVERAENQDPRIRIVAIRALGYHKDPAFAPIIIKHIEEDLSDKVRKESLWALREYEDQSFAPIFLHSLKEDSSVYVRVNALTTLGVYRHRDAYRSVYINCLRDPNTAPEVAEEAVQNIADIIIYEGLTEPNRKALMAELIKAAHHPVRDVRKLAKSKLSEIMEKDEALDVNSGLL